MRCLQTGCDVYFPHDRLWVHGDIYKDSESGIYILYGLPFQSSSMSPDDAFCHLPEDDRIWHRKTRPQNIWVIPSRCIHLTDVGEEFMSKWDF